MHNYVFVTNDHKISEGSVHFIYHHPNHNGAIIKIRKITLKKKPSLRFSKITLHNYREYFYLYKTYILATARSNIAPSYIATPMGFINTNQGVGFVMEKISDKNGDMSKSIRDLLNTKSVTLIEINKKMDELFNSIKKDKAFFHDLSLDNICAERDNFGNIIRLVIVDGIGEGTLIKSRTYLRLIYNYWLQKTSTNLRKEIKLIAIAKHIHL
jgi:hypothetical protein